MTSCVILADEGIETRPFFIPLHRLPPFREPTRGRKYDLGVTDRLGESGMNLPTYADLAETDLDRIADVIGSASR